MMGKIKTFIAVKVSERVNNNVAKVVRRLSALCDQYRWVEHENQLLALNYVGEVIDVEVPELCKLIKDAAEPLESFELSLQGVDGFSSAQEPRTLWIGVDQGREQLCGLYSALEEVLHHLSLIHISEPTRPY